MLSLDFIEPDFDRRNQFGRERFADGSTTDLFGQLLRSKQTFPSRISTLTFGCDFNRSTQHPSGALSLGVLSSRANLNRDKPTMSARFN